jgi:hypothetical protein
MTDVKFSGQNPGEGNVAPVPSAQNRMYSAPRNAVMGDQGYVPGVVSVNYSPNTPTPAGATQKSAR